MIQQKRRRQQENEIPMDVLEEILTKLPAKSLMRFKCVSKLWSSFICSPDFTNRYLRDSLRQSHRLYLCLQDTINYCNCVTLSLAPDTTSSSCFVVNHDLTIPRIGCSIVQNLCNVFMCYIFNGKPVIYNPTTRQLVTLPIPAARKTLPRECHRTVCYYFGYDHVLDQYKVICSIGIIVLFGNSQQIRAEHWVFVLKAKERRFRKKLAPTDPVDFRPHIPLNGGVCIDGVIYYLGWTNMYYPTLLVSFHIRSEDFKTIQLPTSYENDRADLMSLSSLMNNVSLIECSGKVTIINQTELKYRDRLDIWSLEGVENKKWYRKTLVLQYWRYSFDKNTIYNVRGTTQDGKVFFIPKELIYPFHIVFYDLESNDMRRIEIKGVPDHWFRKDKSTINLTVMDLNESLMYFET